MAKLFAGLTYEQAVRKFSKTVAGVCMMRLQNTADAEDCFQNTFVKLWTKAPRFNDEPHLRRWLLKVAVNECNTLLRKHKFTLSLDDVSEASIETDTDARDISWALMKVRAPYREVLYLHYGERYKVSEIAEILDKNPNTIKVMLKRGRDMLREIYGGDAK